MHFDTLHEHFAMHASVAQSVEYDHGKVGVTGSNPVGGFINIFSRLVFIIRA